MTVVSRRRVLAARRAAEGKPAATQKRARPATAGKSAAVSWPSKITVAELDELAAKHGVDFADDATKADKQQALEKAGVGPNGGADE